MIHVVGRVKTQGSVILLGGVHFSLNGFKVPPLVS